MAGAPPRRRDSDSPPALPDELVEEILLSLISTDWGRAISSPAFRRRLHEFHRTPPVLGFLHNWVRERIPRIIPTTASSFSLAAPDCQTWQALDCRHGRVLFLSKDLQGARELLVWEPITGAQRRVPVPPLFESVRKLRSLMFSKEMYPGAAVFCAADGCDHLGCHGHGGPFRLVFVFTNLCLVDTYDEVESFQIWAFVFSSETGTWSHLSMQSKFSVEFPCSSSVLVGRSLLYFMSDNEVILQYDLATHSFSVLLRPPGCRPGYEGTFNVILTEHVGHLGVAEYSDPNLKLWTREASGGTDAHWVLSRVINLVSLLPVGALLDADSGVEVVGFAEGTNTIFLNTVAGIFAVELQSEKARKVCDRRGFGNLVPFVSFYTPVPRGEHQDPSSWEEPCGEEGGQDKKAVEQPQQLFDKGSSTITVEDFVFAAGFSHTLRTRVPSHGEVAVECASAALLHKAQAMNDPLVDVPKTASNEEFVTGATSKDDAGNLKISVSNVEDATPSQKVLP